MARVGIIKLVKSKYLFTDFTNPKKYYSLTWTSDPCSYRVGEYFMHSPIETLLGPQELTAWME